MEGRHLQLLFRALELVESGTVLDRLCGALPSILDVTSAALAVLGPSASGGSVTSSDAVADQIVALHLELGEGPALEAVDTELDVHVEDVLASASRWPAFAAAAHAVDVGAVFALPAQLGGIRVGVLVLCRRAAGRLRVEDLETAGTAVELCTALMLDRGAEAFEVGALPQLLAEWSDGATVHQATGMVAVQVGGDLAGALARLRAYSFANTIPLETVARRVVDRELRFEP